MCRITADRKLRELAKNSEPLEFRLYRGARPKDPVCGMYSFFPACRQAATRVSRGRQLLESSNSILATVGHPQGTGKNVLSRKCATCGSHSLLGSATPISSSELGQSCRNPRLLDFLGSLYPVLLRVAGVSRANHRARLAVLFGQAGGWVRRPGLAGKRILKLAGFVDESFDLVGVAGRETGANALDRVQPFDFTERRMDGDQLLTGTMRDSGAVIAWRFLLPLVLMVTRVSARTISRHSGGMEMSVVGHELSPRPRVFVRASA